MRTLMDIELERRKKLKKTGKTKGFFTKINEFKENRTNKRISNLEKKITNKQKIYSLKSTLAKKELEYKKIKDQIPENQYKKNIKNLGNKALTNLRKANKERSRNIYNFGTKTSGNNPYNFSGVSKKKKSKNKKRKNIIIRL